MDRTSITMLDRTIVIMLSETNDSLTTNSRNLFVAFQLVNAYRYWNLNLNEAMTSCYLVGLINPSSLLISGPSDQLDVIKTAWIKRLLKPPANFTIEGVGEFPTGLRARYVTQQSCISLKEAICYIIFDLSTSGSAIQPESNQSQSTMNVDHVHERSLMPYLYPNQLLRKLNIHDKKKRKDRNFENCFVLGDSWILLNSNSYQTDDQIITFEKIYSRLAIWYSGVILPSQSVILNALEELTMNGYIYQTEYGYNVMTSDKVRVARWIFDQQQRCPHRRRQQCMLSSNTTQLIIKDFNPRAVDKCLTDTSLTHHLHTTTVLGHKHISTGKHMNHPNSLKRREKIKRHNLKFESNSFESVRYTKDKEAEPRSDEKAMREWCLRRRVHPHFNRRLRWTRRRNRKSLKTESGFCHDYGMLDGEQPSSILISPSCPCGFKAYNNFDEHEHISDLANRLTSSYHTHFNYAEEMLERNCSAENVESHKFVKNTKASHSISSNTRTNNSAHDNANDETSKSVNSLVENPKSKITHSPSNCESRFFTSELLSRAFHSMPHSLNIHVPRADRSLQSCLEISGKRLRENSQSASSTGNTQVRV
ncbi:hypothetical protein EG68_01855 [Paragonimus skrjabini miyazakii]|uniref:Winged helix Storkhead-box1 domain-containing protein n=1 Tax=Paragonimus skrjabini miyazakii TaxID=59628 RepID=A0A8S9Z666_9TREM|nr:hypothetical protein EG68_01855 [Paragonimus skrjabini miyazakii]